MSDLHFYGGSPFRIKRPLITTSGIVSEVDPTIKSQLDELNTLLGKRIFTLAPHGAGQPSASEGALAPARTRSANAQRARAAAAPNGGGSSSPDPTALLAKPLT